MKATKAEEVRVFADIPIIGLKMAEDFRKLGIQNPQELTKKDAFELYNQIGKIEGVRVDPCVLDTYIAAIDFMSGAEAKPWWSYTKKRKEKYPSV